MKWLESAPLDYAAETWHLRTAKILSLVLVPLEVLEFQKGL